MKLYKNKEWLKHQYIDLEKSTHKIAEEQECGQSTIDSWVIKFNFKRRNASESQLTLYKNGYINPRKGKHHTEESKQKISDANKGHIAWNRGKTGVYSSETLKQMSETHKGEKSFWFGKYHTNITKNKMSDAKKGKPLSEEHKKKLKGKKPWNKGKTGVYSPETLKQMSEAQKGQIPWIKDKHHTEETKKKISESKKGEKNPMYGKGYLRTKENNPNWNPNREEVCTLYGENFYNTQFRYERWNLQHGRDLLTGDKLERGFYSKYHHIDGNKKNDNKNNHVWVNNSTHGKIHSKYKRKYYEIILQKNLQTLKEGKIPKSWKAKNKEMFRRENLVQLQLVINQIKEKNKIWIKLI